MAFCMFAVSCGTSFGVCLVPGGDCRDSATVML